MIVVMGVVLALVLALGMAWQERRRMAEVRAARAETEAVRMELTEALARMRDERDAALNTDRWMPLSLGEVSRLAKTGCAHCQSAGYTRSGGEHRVCKCVLDRMAGDSRYGMSGGMPVRRMSKAELELAGMEASRC